MNIIHKTKHFIVLVAMIASADVYSQKAASPSQVYVIVHGAWGGSWAFKAVDSLMTAKGNVVYRPSLTGQGERVHLASPDVGLSTHIEDVVNLIIFEKLYDIILVGHSYGGMVISGVAHRVPDRIRKLVYLDAFVPNDGDAVNTMFGNVVPDFIKQNTKDGFIYPAWVKPDQKPPKDVPQSAKTFSEPVTMKNEQAAKLPATYILTIDSGKKAEEDGFYKSYLRAKERGWKLVELSADHNPQWSKVGELVGLLVGEK